MKYRIALISILVLVAFAVRGQVPDKPYVPTGNEGSVIGIISFEGKPPIPKKIDMSNDSVCSKYGIVKSEDLAISRGRLANVLVYVKSAALDKYKFNTPESAVTLTHKRCQLTPRVLGIQTGQRLLMTSDDSDGTIHNYNLLAVRNDRSNDSISPGQAPVERIFTNSEDAITVLDNWHSWEKAYIGVFTHPFFSVSGLDGTFRLCGLPPGQYTIVAWHESSESRLWKSL
jgi:hypothetical protein